MKISNNMRFPHPVLWSRTNDYLKGDFAIATRISEGLNTGRVLVDYSVTIEETAVLALLQSGHALVGLFITCLETYYNKLTLISYPRGQFEVSAGQLRGRVIIRPILWVVRAATEFRSEGLHPEYEGESLTFENGSIIALGEEDVINVGREKLSRLESIFSMARDDTVPEDQVAVQLDDEKIQILARDATFEKIHRLRGTFAGKMLLLNSIYLLAVMNVLACLRNDEGVYEDRRWHRILVAKLEHLGINIKTTDLLTGAQTMLKSPFGRIGVEFDLRSL